ncbi:MAG: hypothetical protein ACKOC0_02455 [Cytophagales bacterium]
MQERSILSPLLVLRVSKRRASPTNKMNQDNRQAAILLTFTYGLCQATCGVPYRNLRPRCGSSPTSVVKVANR